MVYSPPPAPWLRMLQGSDEVFLSDEAKSRHEDKRDSRAYFLDTDLGALEHRQSALEQETSALTHRVHGLGKSEGLRLPPPRRSEKSSPETSVVEGDVAISMWKLRTQPAIMTKGRFGTTLLDLASSQPHARSRVPHDTSIKVYVKDRDSSDSRCLSTDSDIERGGHRMLKRHSESSVNPIVRLNPIRENSSFQRPRSGTPSAEETARRRDVPWGSRDPTDLSEIFRRRSPKVATPDSDGAPRASSTNRRVTIRVARKSVVEIGLPDPSGVSLRGRPTEADCEGREGGD
ncbi:hypothetical protein T484DRAFT_1950133 [Baffinella frigidus]|nr:hypothetical protein T484DRAFT_1950133 [Cryptophyta sp. CCMP2293]|mmetsp:Transcript_27935/g.66571  ORF Transcript_27935/g.66571 Transcript_27935/m.66571 type:complete len:289 (-) Transcript_27935:279-1145(-)